MHKFLFVKNNLINVARIKKFVICLFLLFINFLFQDYQLFKRLYIFLLCKPKELQEKKSNVAHIVEFICKMIGNKRAMIALDCSPEQTEEISLEDS